MPIKGYTVPEPSAEAGNGSRTLYEPPGSENPPYRNSRVSSDAPEVHHEPGVSVYYDSETDLELLLAKDGQSLTIRVGTDRLELSGREWRGLYSGVMNIGPGRETAP